METLKKLVRPGHNINIYSKMVVFYGLLWAAGIAIMSFILLYNNNPPNFSFYTYMAAKRYLDISAFLAVLVIIAGLFYEIYIVFASDK